MTGASIFKKLIEQNYLSRYYWQDYDEAKKFLALILSTKEDKFKLCVSNLGDFSLEKLAKTEAKELAQMIKPSGFYNTKAKKLSELARAICKDFGDFDSFLQNANFTWLNSIKGIGFESAAQLGNHLLEKPFFVMNPNAKKLLELLNYECESYEDASEILSAGLDSEYFYTASAAKNLAQIYTAFSATLDNFFSQHYKNKTLEPSALALLKDLE